MSEEFIIPQVGSVYKLKSGNRYIVILIDYGIKNSSFLVQDWDHFYGADKLNEGLYGTNKFNEDQETWEISYNFFYTRYELFETGSKKLNEESEDTDYSQYVKTQNLPNVNILKLLDSREKLSNRAHKTCKATDIIILALVDEVLDLRKKL